MPRDGLDHPSLPSPTPVQHSIGGPDAALIDLGHRHRAAGAERQTADDDQEEQAYNARSKIEDEIARTPALTIQGLRVKADLVADRVVPSCFEEPYDEPFAQWTLHVLDGVRRLAALDEANRDAHLLDLDRQLRDAIAAEAAAYELSRHLDDGDHPLAAEADRLNDATGAIVDQIASCKATTPAGLMAKVRAFLWCDHGSEVNRERVLSQIEEAGGACDASLSASILLDMMDMPAFAEAGL